MSLHDRIKEARKKRGLTQEQLGSLIGVAKTTITGYEKNREPTAAKLGEIADALGVDVNFLYQDEVKEFHNNRATMEEMEKLVKPYRSLDSHGREIVDFVLAKETDRIQELEDSQVTVMDLSGEPSSKCILAYYGKIAAAGKSYEFNDVTAGTIECPLTKESQRADYAIGVSGDSMEPTFYDGDIVYVKKDVRPKTGDIGIFQKDNGIYIKEVGENELISHNTKYKAITDDGDIVCLGKVIGKVEI